MPETSFMCPADAPVIANPVEAARAQAQLEQVSLSAK